MKMLLNPEAARLAFGDEMHDLPRHCPACGWLLLDGDEPRAVVRYTTTAAELERDIQAWRAARHSWHGVVMHEGALVYSSRDLIIHLRATVAPPP